MSLTGTLGQTFHLSHEMMLTWDSSVGVTQSLWHLMKAGPSLKPRSYCHILLMTSLWVGVHTSTRYKHAPPGGRGSRKFSLVFVFLLHLFYGFGNIFILHRWPDEDLSGCWAPAPRWRAGQQEPEHRGSVTVETHRGCFHPADGQR